ncbi:copper amine oxidase-like domain-containing protein [Deinococcus aerius]|uniref:Copper amine oxidase-like domain-containing protein n=1 Tax=Deinococcus aerius TaxID=200253 RepID=A0A2I9DBS8_9DEIO|nr:copper amine oxidase N-terminal domain-containing protein [Deinococcus aerius]GBF08140.1 copper amine oxidase-like domain-containing protein [Deinococcus aerius]
MPVPRLLPNPPRVPRPRGLLASGRLLLAALALGAAPAAALGAVQLTVSTDQTAASLNGQPVRYLAPPRLVNGRLMLPLRETAALLGQTLTETGGQMGLGRLTVDPAAGSATLGGVSQPGGNVATVDTTVYVGVRLLADALGANLNVDDGGRTVTLTALREGGNPLAPQARFSTDKTVYAPGERIIFTDYPFDPDGADITSRKWTGRQDAYFQPGTYTVTLQVTNSRGLQSQPYSRTIQVQGAAVDTPLSYALKYAEPGDRFADPLVSGYPALTALPVPGPSYPLLFSDSPEAPTQSGVLYQDTVSGRARLLAYHLNALGRPARLYILARNVEGRAVEVRTERLGETAPTRIEGLLGQVTLLDYFASAGGHVLNLAPGQSAAVYASPTLNPGSGVNVMQDLTASGRVELTFVMLEEGLPATAQVVQQIPYLQPDERHQRGTFPNAVRSLRVNLASLPARLVIGDGRVDPALDGVDRLTGRPQRLLGNYGVLYDLQVYGAGGTAVAFSPRGGLYRGAMNIEDGPVSQTIKLPRSGNALTPDQPVLLWRAQSDRLDIDFVPASGSSLPISLVFYPTRPQAGFGGVRKTYQP